MTPLIQIAVPTVLIDAISALGASETFALPAKTCILGWQVEVSADPGAIDIDIDVSMDGTVWTTIDTSTNVAGEFRTIALPTAAPKVRAIVNTNTNGVEVTVTLIAKTLFS